MPPLANAAASGKKRKTRARRKWRCRSDATIHDSFRFLAKYVPPLSDHSTPGSIYSSLDGRKETLYIFSSPLFLHPSLRSYHTLRYIAFVHLSKSTVNSTKRFEWWIIVRFYHPLRTSLDLEDLRNWKLGEIRSRRGRGKFRYELGLKETGCIRHREKKRKRSERRERGRFLIPVVCKYGVSICSRT